MVYLKSCCHSLNTVLLRVIMLNVVLVSVVLTNVVAPLMNLLVVT
jgi:hypothetical protein